MSAHSQPPGTLGSSLTYGRQLVGSGIKGAGTAVREVLGRESAAAALAGAVRSCWKPAAAGACVAIAVSALRKRNPKTALLSGLAGAAVAFSASLIWASQSLTAAAARGAVSSVNAARDAHWLERNPIDYA